MMACRATTLASGLLKQRVDRRTFQRSGGDSYHSKLSRKVIEFIIDEIVKKVSGGRYRWGLEATGSA